MPQALACRKELIAALLAVALLAASPCGTAASAAADGRIALSPVPPDAPAAVVRGAHLVRVTGRVACHTDPQRKDAPFAGGRALKTPFGTFHTPNITPDRTRGIGAWSDADFHRALLDGRAPDGRPYYPAFPDTSYSGLSERDVRDIRAYLSTVPAVPRANRPHAL